MAAAFVAAFETRGVIATPKHFVANVGDGGRDSYPIADGERELRETDFRPFMAALGEGGARSIMTSYNSWNGRPCTANPRLLTGILKGEWAFRGFVISDANAVGGMNDLHLISDSFLESGRQAWAGGLDVIFQTEIGHAELFRGAVVDGLVARDRIDDAVRRVLRAKIELGLFEDPYVDPDEAERTNGAAAHREMARKAARDSVVLLKNDGGLLPISAAGRSPSRSSARTRSRRGSEATAGRASARSPFSTRSGTGSRGPMSSSATPRAAAAGRQTPLSTRRSGSPARRTWPSSQPGSRRAKAGTGPTSGSPGARAR